MTSRERVLRALARQPTERVPRLLIPDQACAGGSRLAPAHVRGPETTWENIVAFFEAADMFPAAYC